MNKAKYDGIDHPVREVTDLKDLIVSSCSMFADKAAYLQKDRPGGTYQPIYYYQVKRDMDALGTQFIEMGLKDKKIAVIGETAYYWFLTYYATVCGTGTVVPLDKNLPADELKNLIRRSKADAIVFSEHSRKTIKGLFEEPFDLKYFISMGLEEDTDGVLALSGLIEKGEKLVESGNRSFIDATIDPDQMATLIFTSGTTGAAKGVMLSHRNITANVINMSKREMLGEDWVVLSILPTHHTFENTCVDWTTFYQGKTLAICEGIRYILKNMNEVHANCMVGVPLVFEKIYKGMMKQADSRGEGEKLRKAIELSRRMGLYNNRPLMKKLFKAIHDALGGEMQMFIAGGAAIDPQVIRDFEAMGIPMMQGYGMTECAPIICVNQDNYSIAESVGRPMSGTTVRIDEPNDEGVGEIVCKGPSVMMGYYEDEAATAEVLRDGWLYTGDLGYMDDRGFVYVTGRKKTVIVTKGGKNIFPEEIEEVIKQNPLVKEVLVHGVTDKKIGNIIITADVQPNFEALKAQNGEMTDSEIYHFYRDLIDQVNDTLPAYKNVKRVNIRKTDFAMTTTGKIKRYNNFVEGEENGGSVDYLEVKNEERRRANKLIKKNIGEATDSHVVNKTGKAVTDIKNLISVSAEAYGEKPAFIYRKSWDEGMQIEKMSYRAFQAEINGLGTALVNLGVKGGAENSFTQSDESWSEILEKKTKIAVIGENSIKAIISMFAVTNGLGILVLPDRYAGEEKLISQMQKAGVSTIIFDGKYREQMDKIAHTLGGIHALIDMDAKEHEGGIYSWDKLSEQGKEMASQGDRQFIDSEIIGDDPAAVVYTPGTEGKHKAVVLSNYNIVSGIMGAHSIMGYAEDDVVLSTLSLHRVAGAAGGVLMPLYAGACVAISDEKSLLDDVRDFEATVVVDRPSVFADLYGEVLKVARASGKDGQIAGLRGSSGVGRTLRLSRMRSLLGKMKNLFGSKMRLFVSLGTGMDEDIMRVFSDMGITSLQGYSITECASLVAINPATEDAIRRGASGHLIPGMEVTISGPDNGGIGEICLRGDNVMLGYLGDQDATDAVKVDDWYHTGDIGCFDSEGFLYVTGRKKDER